MILFCWQAKFLINSGLKLSKLFSDQQIEKITTVESVEASKALAVMMTATAQARPDYFIRYNRLSVALIAANI